MQERGQFLVLEGNDGAGKTDAVEGLKQHIETQYGKKVLVLQEPGGTPLGQVIRTWLKYGTYQPTQETELLLFMAARFESLLSWVEGALRTGYWVIADRFALSSYVYQVRSDRTERLYEDFMREIQQITPVDFLVYLSVDWSTAQARMSQSDTHGDRLDPKSEAVFTERHTRYVNALSEYAHTGHPVLTRNPQNEVERAHRFAVIDANGTREETLCAIQKQLDHFLFSFTLLGDLENGTEYSALS